MGGSLIPTNVKSQFPYNPLSDARCASDFVGRFLFGANMAAEFPLPSASASNPVPLFYEQQAEEFVVGRTIYDDNGADYKLQNGGSGRKVWIIRYDGLTDAEAAILDAHLASTFYSDEQGSATGFNFRHHVPGSLWSSTSGTLHSGVHYAPGGYKKSHTKTWSCAREIMLEKRP